MLKPILKSNLLNNLKFISVSSTLITTKAITLLQESLAPFMEVINKIRTIRHHRVLYISLCILRHFHLHTIQPYYQLLHSYIFSSCNDLDIQLTNKIIVFISKAFDQEGSFTQPSSFQSQVPYSHLFFHVPLFEN